MSDTLVPSRARTVPLPVPGECAISGASVRLRPLVWPAKAAGDALDYSLDCSRWLADCADSIDKIAIDLVSVAPAADLTIQWAIFQNGLVTVALAGGRPLLRYQLRLVVTTTQGRSITTVCTLPVSTIQTTAGTGALTKPGLTFPAGTITINGTPNT